MIEKQIGNYARDGHGLWCVRIRESDQPIGAVGLVTQMEEGETFHEIGYMIHRPYWRQGYAYEAAAAVRDWAFANHAYDPVVSFVRPQNTPSQAVARKLGMTPQDRLIDHAGLPHHVFEISRRSWEDQR
ncbi:anhydro-N-acetylmuramic acid kinase [Stratiformator vulcanicus]|uniref:Anhydro-N-acetylmuramic acid kinase n=1 Tax=Stratiformator vulcanicus TaxID=2527980 RepID=A0A517R7D8_9PLAN|nr:anhydro-N-acetylmuramic acid kinase [Stratiformator vulcanicus]